MCRTTDTSRGACNRRGVQAARKMDSDRNVAAHVLAHGVFEQLGETTRNVIGFDRTRLIDAPVACLTIASIRNSEGEAMARRQLPDSAIERRRCFVQTAIDQE